MAEQVDYLLPGEQLVPRKPWLRLVGDEVVRYVRPTMESDRVKRARQFVEFTGERILEGVLEHEAKTLQKHLDLLRECGIPVVGTSVEITHVPEDYPSSTRAIGSHLGMMIRSEAAHGPALDGFLLGRTEPEWKRWVSEPVVGGLINYFQEVGALEEVGEDPRFLADLYKPEQYVVDVALGNGLPLAKLVDVDPKFELVTAAKTSVSIALTNQMFQAG